MALMVDPQKDAGGERVSAGRKLAMAVGMNRWTAGTGTPMLTMGFVVLRDGAKAGDEGRVFMERFALTQNALFRLARWANATGWVEPFDADSDEDLAKVMARGAVVAVLKDEQYEGKTRTAVDRFDPYNGPNDPQWDAMSTAGEQEFQRIMQAMQNKRGGSNGGGNGSHPHAPGNTGGPPHDSIPF